MSNEEDNKLIVLENERPKDDEEKYRKPVRIPEYVLKDLLYFEVTESYDNYKITLYLRGQHFKFLKRKLVIHYESKKKEHDHATGISTSWKHGDFVHDIEFLRRYLNKWSIWSEDKDEDE